MVETKFHVGMTCSGCSDAVTRILSKIEGVESVKADLEAKTVTVQADPSVSPQLMLEKLEKVSFDRSKRIVSGSASAPMPMRRLAFCSCVLMYHDLTLLYLLMDSVGKGGQENCGAGIIVAFNARLLAVLVDVCFGRSLSPDAMNRLYTSNSPCRKYMASFNKYEVVTFSILVMDHLRIMSPFAP